MKTKFWYLRSEPARGAKRGFPVACIAFTEGDGHLRYGVSIYNPKDTFDKKMARRVAEGRMAKHNREVPFITGQNPLSVIAFDVQYLLNWARGSVDPDMETIAVEDAMHDAFGTTGSSTFFKAINAWIGKKVDAVVDEELAKLDIN